jgi:hypothetical protein
VQPEEFSARRDISGPRNWRLRLLWHAMSSIASSAHQVFME